MCQLFQQQHRHPFPHRCSDPLRRQPPFSACWFLATVPSPVSRFLPSVGLPGQAREGNMRNQRRSQGSIRSAPKFTPFPSKNTITGSYIFIDGYMQFNQSLEPIINSLNLWTARLIRILVIICTEFQYSINMIVVVLLTIFPMVLVSLNSVQQIRSNRQISTAARLG